MHVFETLVRPGDEARRFATAIHRFIELRAADSEFSVSVRSEPLGEQERKVLTLWSDQAVDDFAALWRDLREDLESVRQIRQASEAGRVA